MRRACRGHNLLEMILACFIFATVTIGLTTIWVQHSHVMAKAGSRLVGQFLANQIMEECIAAGYESVQLLDTSTTPRVPMEMKEIVRDETKVVFYTPTITVTDSTILGMKTVQVKVEWDEEGRKLTGPDPEKTGRGSIEYTSQLSKNGAPASPAP